MVLDSHFVEVSKIMLNYSMKTQPRTVLVCCPNWVGDVVMATPALDCLRQNYPEARLVGVIRSYVRGVVEDGPWFDQIIACDDRTIRGFRKLVQTIRSLSPDMAIVLPSSIRFALAVLLGGVKEIFGYRRNGRSLLLSGGPKPIRAKNGILPIRMVEYYMEICRWLHLKIPEMTKPSLFSPVRFKKKGINFLIVMVSKLMTWSLG